jgi:hypothetical protein
MYTALHLTDWRAFHRDYPDKTREQWRWARNQTNQRRRERGESPLVPVTAPTVNFTDKQVGTADWRKISEWVSEGQSIRNAARWDQRTATIEVTDVEESILLVPLSDTHVGSWGADLSHLVALTEEVLANPRLYLAGVGDLINLAIKLRGVLEVKDDLLPPDLQHSFIEAWLNEIEPKLLFAGWGNHDIEREEAGSGASIHQNMLARRVPYFAGIGHVNLVVGAQTYHLAVSHRFRGSSSAAPLAGQKKYMRFEGADREIAIGGDLHRPCYEAYFDGPTHRVALNCGALQTDSPYAARYFSLYTIPEYPVLELFSNEHRVIPYRNLGDWKATVNRKAA